MEKRKLRLSADRNAEGNCAAGNPIDMAPANQVEIDCTASNRPAQARLTSNLALIAREGLDHQVQVPDDRDLCLRTHEHLMAIARACP